MDIYKHTNTKIISEVYMLNSSENRGENESISRVNSKNMHSTKLVSCCLPSHHPGVVTDLAAAGQSVCSAALPESSSLQWGDSQGDSLLESPGFEWADESENEQNIIQVAMFFNMLQNCFSLVLAQSTCWFNLRPPDSRLVIIWGSKEKKQ